MIHFSSLITAAPSSPVEIALALQALIHQPRSALGYYEPGHYCFVVVDGREKGHSVGMYLAELAQLFEDLGCTSAYNMDGGGSASLTFQGEYFSKPSEVRSIGDILLIAEP